MFKNKRNYAICLIVETILPWFVLVCGFPAIINFDLSGDTYNGGNYGPEYLEYNSLFHLWYSIANIIGWIVVVVEWIFSMISFIVMISKITDRSREKYSVIKPLISWLYSGFCILGTLLLMLFVHTFTYGMSI